MVYTTIFYKLDLKINFLINLLLTEKIEKKTYTSNLKITYDYKKKKTV